MSPNNRYMSAKDLAPILDRSIGWLYYHSRASNGPIRRTRGKDRVLMHVGDATYFAKGYERGQNSGKLYPASIPQLDGFTPAELRQIEALGLHSIALKAAKDAIAAVKSEKVKSSLKIVNGGKR